jgi:fumarate hydratase subunit alpha
LHHAQRRRSAKKYERGANAYRRLRGSEGIKNFVVEKVKQAGGQSCPPIIVGVGIAAHWERSVCFSQKKALLRPVGEANNNDEHLAQMGKKRNCSTVLNKTGYRPGGLGGRNFRAGRAY